jgi:hypothetical protein
MNMGAIQGTRACLTAAPVQYRGYSNQVHGIYNYMVTERIHLFFFVISFASSIL